MKNTTSKKLKKDVTYENLLEKFYENIELTLRPKTRKSKILCLVSL